MVPNQKDPNYISALLADWGPIHESKDGDGRWLISYNFMSAAESGPEQAQSGFQALSEGQRAAVRQALDTIGAYINVHFVEVAENGDLSYGRTEMPDGVGAYSYPTLGDIYFDREQSDWSPGSWQYQTILHETGHILGLEHPGDYNGADGKLVDNHFSDPEAVGNTAYTLMSYQDYGTHYAVTPMLYDVAALQQLYGAASTGAGDDSYRLAIGDSGPAGRFTLYDSGGTDTLVADSRRPQLIDLGEGHFSRNLDDGEYAFSIAYGTTIENATGSPFDDQLIGNGQGNLLDGGGGSDILSGGGGADIFRFSQYQDSFRNEGSNQNHVDTIQDFTSDDRIDVSALGFTGLGSGYDHTLSVVPSGDGSQTYLRDLAGDASGNRFEVALQGDHQQLAADDFIFAPAPSAVAAEAPGVELGLLGVADQPADMLA